MLMNVNDILLEGCKRGIKQAIDLSIRTGVPLVIERNGKIIEIPPKYKYVRVPIKKQKKTVSKT